MWALWPTPDRATPNVRMINRHPAPGNADTLRESHRFLIIVEFDRSLTAVAAAALRPVAGYHGAIKKLVVPTYISSSVLTIDPTGRLHCTEIVHHVVLYEQELVAPEVGWGRPRPVTIVIRSASPRRTVVDDDTGQAALW